MIRKFRKRPVVVDVVLFDGTNKSEVDAFVGRDLVRNPDGTIIIPTLEGQHIASIGDFIICGVHGEHYPCKPDIFEKTYRAGVSFPASSQPDQSMSEKNPSPGTPPAVTPIERLPARKAPVDRSAWPTPWAQLKFYSFQPAIFPRMLGAVSRDAKPGDLVSVFDKAGEPLGAGLFNPRAKIPLRVIAHGAEPIGEDYLERALRRAIAFRRETLRLDAQTDAYRLVSSDGDGISGLTIDRYGDVLFCEVNSLGLHQRLPRWLPMLHELAGTKHARIHVDHEIASAEGIKLSLTAPITATAPTKVRVTEHGVRFEVDFAEGHKTGFFCDQRDNRRRLADFTRGARVLDLCSYTGGFGITAAKIGEAADVTGVDLDETAVAQARRNAQLNQLSTAKIRWVHTDAFAYARQMRINGEKWDVVVLDPPKLVMTREPEGAAEGHRKYEDLNSLGIMLVKPDGLFVTCSCSGLVSLEAFENHVIKAAHRLGRRLQIINVTGAGPDHPVYSNCLESRYLKVIWARVV